MQKHASFELTLSSQIARKMAGLKLPTVATVGLCAAVLVLFYAFKGELKGFKRYLFLIFHNGVYFKSCYTEVFYF